MENQMETTGIVGIMLGLYPGYIGRMEKKMETTIVSYPQTSKLNPFPGGTG